MLSDHPILPSMDLQDMGAVQEANSVTRPMSSEIDAAAKKITTASLGFMASGTLQGVGVSCLFYAPTAKEKIAGAVLIVLGGVLCACSKISRNEGITVLKQAANTDHYSCGGGM